jgi:hypothetical protein
MIEPRTQPSAKVHYSRNSPAASVLLVFAFVPLSHHVDAIDI